MNTFACFNIKHLRRHKPVEEVYVRDAFRCKIKLNNDFSVINTYYLVKLCTF